MLHTFLHIFISVVLVAAYSIESQRIRNKQINDDSLISIIGIMFVANLFELGVAVWKAVA